MENKGRKPGKSSKHNMVPVKQENVGGRKREFPHDDDLVTGTQFSKMSREEKVKTILAIDSAVKDEVDNTKDIGLKDIYKRVICEKYPEDVKRLFPKSPNILATVANTSNPAAQNELGEESAEEEEVEIDKEDAAQIEAFLKPNYEVLYPNTTIAVFGNKEQGASDEEHIQSLMWDLLTFILAETGLKVERNIAMILLKLRKEFFLDVENSPPTWTESVNRCSKLIRTTLQRQTGRTTAAPPAASSEAGPSSSTAAQLEMLQTCNTMLTTSNNQMVKDMEHLRKDLEKKEADLQRVKDKYRKLKEQVTRASSVKQEPKTVSKVANTDNSAES